MLAESGLNGTESRVYSNPDPKIVLPISVTAYKLHDSSGAYEAYTFLRQSPDIVDQDKSGKHALLIGNIVLVMRFCNFLEHG